VIFAYPLIGAVAERLDPRAMPWWHQVRSLVGQRLITPSMVVVLAAGIYLAAKDDAFSKFYVGWGFVAIVVLGGLGGMFFTPKEKKLEELARRDVAAAGHGEVTWSAEYTALQKQVARVGGACALLVAVTIIFMALHLGQ